jgi:hypothetical protein
MYGTLNDASIAAFQEKTIGFLKITKGSLIEIIIEKIRGSF